MRKVTVVVAGTTPYKAGKNKANPIASMLTLEMMLEHLGFGEAALDLGAAVQSAVQSNQLTEEVGGALGTREVGDFIASQLA